MMLECRQNFYQIHWRDIRCFPQKQLVLHSQCTRDHLHLSLVCRANNALQARKSPMWSITLSLGLHTIESSVTQTYASLNQIWSEYRCGQSLEAKQAKVKCYDWVGIHEYCFDGDFASMFGFVLVFRLLNILLVWRVLDNLESSQRREKQKDFQPPLYS